MHNPDLIVRPLTPVPPHRERDRSPFSAGWSQTVRLLQDEARHLGARRVVLLLAVGESDLRLDGWIKANARLTSPAAAVALDTKWGPIRYATDRYWTWQDNVRAISLSLQALRSVNRYGVATDGEQYRGWLALPAGSTTGGFTSAEAAARWMLGKARPDGWVVDDLPRVLESDDALNAVYRRAATHLHPDASGDAEEFKRLTDARDYIRAARA